MQSPPHSAESASASLGPATGPASTATSSATSSPPPQSSTAYSDARTDGAQVYARKSPISDQTATAPKTTMTPPAPMTLPSLSREHDSLPPLKNEGAKAQTGISLGSRRLADDQRPSGPPTATAHIHHPSPPPIATLSQPPSISPSLSSSSLDRSTGPSPAPAFAAGHHSHQHQQQHQQLQQQQQQQQLPQPPPPPPMHMHAATTAHAYAPYDHLDRRTLYQYSPPQDPHYRQYPAAQQPPHIMSQYPPPAHMVPAGLPAAQGHHQPHDVGYPYPGREPYTIIYTEDATTKLSDRVRRRCFNCCTTDTSTWRRSSLNPGKVLCNKCGLFERTHSRPRPEQFPHKRGPLSSASLRARTSPTQLTHPPPSLPSVASFPSHPYAHHPPAPVPPLSAPATQPQPASSSSASSPAPRARADTLPPPPPPPQSSASASQLPAWTPAEPPAPSPARTPPESHRGTATPLRARSP